MSISIHTLAILLSIANLLYVLVLYRQYRLTPTLPGVKLWVIGGALLAGGFFLNFLRAVPGLAMAAIMLSNILWLAGALGLYTGVLQFLQRPVTWRLPALVIGAGMLLYAYFMFFQHDDLAPRRILFSLLTAWLLGLIAWALWRHHAAAVRGSALFLAWVFGIESAFFLLRLGFTLLFGAESGQGGFSAEPIQVLSYLVAFICSSLWTFGFILLVNQRLNTDYLAAKQQAEAADRAKQTFLANISHELNTPLHAILGHLHLCHDQAKVPAQREHLQCVQAGAAHLHTLVNAILDSARLEQGQYSYNPAPLDLPGLLAHVRRIVELCAEAKTLQLRLTLPAEMPLKIVADGLYLRQILLNLLNNAINYTRQGWVELALSMDALPTGDMRLQFIVSDSGPGIADTELARLLRPFERGDSTQPGAGLGLSIVSHLLARMGSELRVASMPGQGSQFSFAITVPVLLGSADVPAEQGETSAIPGRATLRQLWQDTLLGRFPALTAQLARLPPAQSGFAQRAQAFATAADKIEMIAFLRQHWAVEAVAPTLDNAVVDAAALRLLIIDDDAFSIHLLAHYLRDFDCDILSAAHGEDGLQLARRFPPHLIVLDIHMPGIDGLETCRRLKADAATQAIPVVFFSAKTDEHAAAFAAGAVDYLRKPMREEELMARITAYLQHPQLHSGHIKRLQGQDDGKRNNREEYVLRRMYEIRDRLLNDLQHTPPLEELARDSGLNRNKINEHFKLLFGNTPHAWQREQRLQAARQILQESDADIAIVARDTGHASAASFSRAFKQRFGLSPVDFRLLPRLRKPDTFRLGTDVLPNSPPV
jgi:signal transduction histidine kinase/CheY-like chemotaxis protein/AraC-like DNA-binding protein